MNRIKEVILMILSFLLKYREDRNNVVRCTMPECTSFEEIKPFQFNLPPFKKPIIVGELCKKHREMAEGIIERANQNEEN